jgi:putative acetyltransferase
MMIEIKPLEQHQISDAKKVILTVGRKLYQWEETIEEIQERFDRQGELSDIDNFQSHYFENNGLFLVLTDDNQVIGTGAVRRLDENVCELKRLWLLEPYQGKGIGYRVLQKLIKFAQEKGYKKILLETDHEQKRAIQFYRKVGFQSTDKYNDRNSDVYMEMGI